VHKQKTIFGHSGSDEERYTTIGLATGSKKYFLGPIPTDIQLCSFVYVLFITLLSFLLPTLTQAIQPSQNAHRYANASLPDAHILGQTGEHTDDGTFHPFSQALAARRLTTVYRRWCIP
jgi:hypothetical protein